MTATWPVRGREHADAPEPSSAPPGASRWSRLRDLLGAPGLAGTTLLGLLVTVSAVGPSLLGNDGRERVAAPYARPGPGLPLGADDIGRDLFAQLVVGSRASLTVAFSVALAASLLATLVGGAAGVGPRPLSMVLMRSVDVVLTLPFLPLLIVAAAFLGQGAGIRIALLSLLAWAGPSRVVRASVLSAWSRGHLEVARAMGAPAHHLLLRHASYVVAPLLIPVFTRTAMSAVMLDASLAFLGLGDPSTPSWGTTLYWASVNGAFLSAEWLWWAVPPGLAITVTVVSLGLVGVAVEERLNPVLRKGR